MRALPDIRGADDASEMLVTAFGHVDAHSRKLALFEARLLIKGAISAAISRVDGRAVRGHNGILHSSQ